MIYKDLWDSELMLTRCKTKGDTYSHLIAPTVSEDNRPRKTR